MNSKNMSVKEKKEKIKELYNEAVITNVLIEERFDLSSNKMLDEKIEVLKRYIEGEKPGEIDNFYDVLELIPKDEYNEETGEFTKVNW